MAEQVSIKFIRGTKANLNTLVSGSSIDVGKPYMTTDSGLEELYIGTAADSVQLVGKVIVDIAANQPAAGVEGRLFYATDTDTMYIDDGASWQYAGVTNLDDIADGTSYQRVAASEVDSSGYVTQINDGTNTVTAAQSRGHIDSALNPHSVTLEQARTEGNSLSGDINANNNTVTGLKAPSSDSDAATKLYVDTTVQGLDAKASVRAATTSTEANLGLTGAENIDGVTDLVNGERVLVKNQVTNPEENGIYVYDDTGAWTRANDADTWDELVSAFVFVEEGTENGDNGFVCTVDAGGTLETTSVSFTQFSGAGQITAGDGLTKTGNTLDVGAGDGITVNADDVAVNADSTGGANLATSINVSANGVAIKIDDSTIKENGSGQLYVSAVDGGTF